MPTDGLVERLLSGDKRALARVISKIEREDPATREIIAEVYPRTGDALTVGFTGPPGVGKSSIIAKLIKLYRDDAALADAGRPREADREGVAGPGGLAPATTRIAVVRKGLSNGSLPSFRGR